MDFPKLGKLDDPRPDETFTNELLRWFGEQSRDLPWRGVADPYAVWVSELMLQQTRVETVIPYFHRWMERFPTIRTLADSSIDDVLEAWQGLGYYRRARYLHQGANIVVDEHNGVFPSSLDDIRALPGIGSYTAGAIASLAFGVVAPAVDGNVLRVLSRLFADDRDISKASTRTAFERGVETLIPAESPGDFNEALIELGATVCRSTSPACLICPVQSYCQAFAEQRVGELPVKKGKTRVRDESRDAFVLVSEAGRALVAKRSQDQLLGGLWEFPLVATGSDFAEGNRAHAGTVKHVFSHIRLRVEVYVVPLGDPNEGEELTTLTEPSLYEEYTWVSAKELGKLAQSTLMRKLRGCVSEVLA